MFENESDLLTRKRAQELLCVSKNTILNLISTHKIPTYLIAGSYRIKKEDLIEFIDRTIVNY